MENNVTIGKHFFTLIMNSLTIPVLALTILVFFNDPIAPILVFLTGAILNFFAILTFTTGSNPTLKKNMQSMYQQFVPLNPTLAVSRVVECVLIIGLIGIWMPSFIGLSIYTASVVIRYIREVAAFHFVTKK